jgi:PhzF family phenazine biosynthesis protein
MERTGFTYATIDVFTNEKCTGNQLAIVQLPPSGLSQEQKQAVAKEFNYSETVFVHTQNDSSKINEWIIDIFTLDAELPFAGHPVIGTACFLLSALGKGEKVVKGSFQTKAGRINLEYDVGKRAARAAIPHNVHIHKSLLETPQLMKLQPKVGVLPALSPVVSIVKGMTFVLVELDSQDALTFVNTTPYPINVELDEGWDESFIGCYFYYRLPASDGDTRMRLRTRMIESSVGEDAATGSAACALASYLSIQEGKPGTKLGYDIVQGLEMGRRSEIGVDVGLANGRMIESLHLSGSAVQMMEGKLFL